MYTYLEVDEPYSLLFEDYNPYADKHAIELKNEIKLYFPSKIYKYTTICAQIF